MSSNRLGFSLSNTFGPTIPALLSTANSVIRLTQVASRIRSSFKNKKKFSLDSVSSFRRTRFANSG